MCICVYVCVYVHTSAVPTKARAIASPGIVVTGGYKLPDVSAEN